VADLLVVDGDPLDDVTVLADPAAIWLVIHEGRVVRSADRPEGVEGGSASRARRAKAPGST
jgi:hypothetical protein